jgi:hypothetical protein
VVCCCRRTFGKWLPENHLAYVVDLAEIGYGAEVRLSAASPEGDIFHQSPFWLVRIAAAEVVSAVVRSHPCRDEAATWMGYHNCRGAV